MDRKAVTDRFLEPPEPEPVELPFIHVPPPPRDVERSASEAPVLDLFETLRGYAGEAAADLPRLTFIVDWAIESGAVRRHRGRLVAVKRWAETPVIERAERSFSALIELGPLWSQLGNFGLFGDLHAVLDDGIPHWLAALLALDEERGLDEVVELARRWRRASGTFLGRGPGDAHGVC